MSQVAAVWRKVCGTMALSMPASSTARFQPTLTDLTGAPCHSTTLLSDHALVAPAAQVRQQPRRYWRRGLPLASFRLAFGETVEDAAVEVKEAAVRAGADRRRETNSRPRAAINGEQDGT